ncbi:hypothetical protein EDB81DRAFT_879346 [Dactylonectria macrodidyma]|uniref:Uncharacterized protein n=1 Tax=Dactylonectria macrodidyma TaxID=307937 RepID=A0A9P9JD31_9HYPO|nr:hypothetical protein EDB81DRAFT_879346 [Dactylonectria macrodidyma]
MAILGDIIQLHHLKDDPHFGCGRRDEEQANETALVEGIVAECERSIADMATRFEVHTLDDAVVPRSQMMMPTSLTLQKEITGPPLPGPHGAHFLLELAPESDTTST